MIRWNHQNISNITEMYDTVNAGNTKTISEMYLFGVRLWKRQTDDQVTVSTSVKDKRKGIVGFTQNT